MSYFCAAASAAACLVDMLTCWVQWLAVDRKSRANMMRRWHVQLIGSKTAVTCVQRWEFVHVCLFVKSKFWSFLDALFYGRDAIIPTHRRSAATPAGYGPAHILCRRRTARNVLLIIARDSFDICNMTVCTIYCGFHSLFAYFIILLFLFLFYICFEHLALFSR